MGSNKFSLNMYRPLPKELTIKNSPIEGLGLYAIKNIKANSFIGVTHIRDEQFENKYIRTPLGGYYNHSNKPNVMMGIHKDHYYAYWLEPVNHEFTIEHMEIYYVGNEAANSKKFKNLRKQNLKLWYGVQLEDVHIIEGMQKGRNSPSYNGGNFSPVMDNPTHHFHKWVATNLV